MSARLPVRLVGAFLAVLAIGTVISLVTVRALAPELFAGRMGAMGGRMMGAQNAEDTRAALIAALDQALLVGALVAAVVAGVAAVLLARGVLRPLEQVRGATRQIAAGRYDVRVPVPGEPEMAALAADVNTLAGALADTETRRVRLLGEVAHEMRTPLTGLSGYVEGLVDGVFPADQSTLGAMTEDLRRLRRLADDLSALSRNEEGRLDLDPAPCDLADIVRRTCARFEPRLSDAGLRLEVHANGPLPVVADEDRIAQVLTNLLSNAARATAQATAGTPGQIRVVATAAGSWASVAVSDTGVGLTALDLERVFERFYRVAGTPRGEGSGIGLTIARGLARAHGGDLVATSTGLGHGATFTLQLPIRSSRGGGSAPAQS
jgi:histidine kinase